MQVDAHVGKSLFHDAILTSLRDQGKTVVFVTHALHFLSYCDYIYTMRDGCVAEQGTFEELIHANGEFARLDKEFGGGDSEQGQQSNGNGINKEDLKTKLASTSRRQAATGTGKLEGKLIVKERRSTGSISNKGIIDINHHNPVAYPLCRVYYKGVSSQVRTLWCGGKQSMLFYI